MRSAFLFVSILCGIAGLAILVVRLTSTTNTESTEIQSLGQIAKPHVAAASQDLKGVAGSGISTRMFGFLSRTSNSGVEIKPLSHWHQSRVSPDEAISNLTVLLQKASLGDVQSNITVFEASQWCVVRRAEAMEMQLATLRGALVTETFASNLTTESGKCASLPQDIQASRFDFLRNAANAGNVEAMVAFERALLMSARYDPAWLWGNIGKIPQMQIQAIDFLEQAASLGVREAYVELAYIYQRGRYGVKDPAKAEFYLGKIN